MILVTGGAGFIGANFMLHWFRHSDEPIVNLDKLTYAGNRRNPGELSDDPRRIFVHGDIGDRSLLRHLFREYPVRAVVHMAAETHVDRSIADPGVFIQTNVNGTFALLDEALVYWDSLDEAHKTSFRFLHISTDEVYGSLGPDDLPFAENSRYAPNNHYAASKAAADHFVRSFNRTHGLPTLIINSSNNFGPRQHPEKLIPRMIGCALKETEMPLYGDGQHVRDWLYVDDHCAGICAVLERGRIGEAYNIGGQNERTNGEIVGLLCDELDSLKPRPRGRSYRELIGFVEDRPGHDRRYAMDTGKILGELGWRPQENIEDAMRRTVHWYVNHPDWLKDVAE